MTATAPPAAGPSSNGVETPAQDVPRNALRAWLARHPLAAYAVRRFGLYLVELWGALTIAFFFFRLMPGDPIQTLIQSLQQNYVYNQAGERRDHRAVPARVRARRQHFRPSTSSTWRS